MSDNAAFVTSVENATLAIILKLGANMNKACLVVERSAKQGCPVDSGALRADIQSTVKVSDTAIVGRIGNTVGYAPYVHNGTGIYAKDGNGRKTPWFFPGAISGKYKGGGWITQGQKPQPYLEKARAENIGKIVGILGE